MSVLGVLSACCVLMVISKVSSSNGLQIEKRAAIVTAISSWDKKSTSKPLFSFRDDNVSYQVYSSYSSDGKYQGYFLQDNIKGSIPYAYSGSYLPTSPLELSELFEGEGATEFSDLSNKSGVSATTDFSSKRYICNPSNLVKYESSSQAFSYYTVSTSSSFSEYQDYLRNSHNPAMVFIPNHFVLGIGFSSTRPYPNIPSQNYLIAHYGWDSRPGNYYVNTSEMKSFVYIWR